MRADTKPRALAHEAKSRCDQSENTKEPRLSSLRTRGALSEVWGRRSCFSGPLFLSRAGALLPGSCPSKKGRCQASAECLLGKFTGELALRPRGAPSSLWRETGGLSRGSEKREGPEWTKVWNEHSGVLSAHRICVTALPSIH